MVKSFWKLVNIRTVMWMEREMCKANLLKAIHGLTKMSNFIFGSLSLQFGLFHFFFHCFVMTVNLFKMHVNSKWQVNTTEPNQLSRVGKNHDFLFYKNCQLTFAIISSLRTWGEQLWCRKLWLSAAYLLNAVTVTKTWQMKIWWPVIKSRI